MSHKFDPTILREYDIRGIVGETLGPDDAYAIGRGFATRLLRAGGHRVAVGYDGRTSSPTLARALIKGLTESGVNVVNIGMASTPMLYFAEATLKVDGGVQITGSHNPAEYNGFKMVLKHNSFFGKDIRDIGILAEKSDWEKGRGGVETADIIEPYVNRLLQGYEGGVFRIGWDAGNGAGGPVIEKLIKKLPGEHHVIYTDVDGSFPNHHPDPTVEANLEDLKNLVKEEKLDFGFAFDGDADRIGAVDSEGHVIWGDQILAILAAPVLKRHPNATIIADVKASQALFDRVKELGGKPLMGRTGHSLIKTLMKETNSPLAGEMSGHIFFADQWFGFDDGIYAAIRLISAINDMGGSLTKIRKAMPKMVNTPELRFQASETRKFAVIGEVLGRLTAENADVNTIDGVRVTTKDGWWLLRASNTQDVLVARAEGRDQAALDRLIAQLNDQLKKSGIEPVTTTH
ncbi:MAG: phosphomannomutase/phosphoglucomutase [Zymomonas mobilis subsp. pomaceae]|uniref:Phosphomannomutase n=1 Tax=Zymomonas mobilis subsp. pomaceae (strain ATCC 29192 / DSM 22645 / JCM 10191 / CCUG 17912 / NBRC 13757 / NCIMB 11200 / NRRL B-4491 / Barker I) TaxID=579138 RepID=F8ESI1_ZYMMT|nr:phosphomannomutase/phosphoglucomutase [Zymomonas mobilis]AEI37756.1 Phosphomannomutase [Zymomonas mobilis subsp. pomaceae ATCC 29192]MDX5949123.1 phosphomannomutase/phosphoglucomutase [Zymomonas mobilis subsp. pomaceae]GEB88930.1 phosphomannomutase [Zymomonas mobilis subsp. pomaceae]